MTKTKKNSQTISIDFIRMRWITFLISGFLSVMSIYLVATTGLNFGTDFTGGTAIEIKVEKEIDLSLLRKDFRELNRGDISIQEFGAPQDLLIRVPEQKDESGQQDTLRDIRAVLDERFDNKVDYRRIEYVGPQVGDELKMQGLYAILLSVLGIVVYVVARYDWKFGVAAIAALIHDTLTTVGLFALTGMEFNLATVAAILLIAGYSTNDTVIIFDRIRENLRKFKKMPLGELLNLSVHETLSRTIMTSFTTLLALLALWIFGGEVIQGFVNALLFGIAIGTYSSIFIAAPILLVLGVDRKADIATPQAGAEVLK
jgi:preprotein translocase SecF subunit